MLHGQQKRRRRNRRRRVPRNPASMIYTTHTHTHSIGQTVGGAVLNEPPQREPLQRNRCLGSIVILGTRQVRRTKNRTRGNTCQGKVRHSGCQECFATCNSRSWRYTLVRAWLWGPIQSLSVRGSCARFSCVLFCFCPNCSGPEKSMF